jgi:L-asparagine transporter-like permease
MLSHLLTYISAITIKQAIKDVKWAVKTIKIGKIFMFYHLKPWKSWQVGLSSFI